MYKGYFGFERSPFELSPDPSFFFPLEKTKEALASIYYALCQRKGFVVLTGEVGTGKTLLIRCLLELMKRQQIPSANVFNPRLSDIDFLSYVSFDLGIQVTERSKSSLLRALYSFLLVQMRKGLTTVLVIDEAHQAPLEVLEEIRLLTNLETGKEKLIQLVLVGQPEFDTRLDSFELRQLKQRIAIRCRLEPFTIMETRQYIEGRLTRAGAGPTARAIFPLETVEAIHRYSLGIPRLINSICDQSLIAAYARESRSVPVEFVDEVASYFRLQPVPELVDNIERAQFAEQREAANYLLQVIESIKRQPAVRLHRQFL
jgi:general secretion pathway protein A